MKNFKTTFNSCPSFYFFVVSLLEEKGYDTSMVTKIFGAAATRSGGMADFNTLYVDVVNKTASSVRGYGTRIRKQLDEKFNPISIDIVSKETDIDESHRIIEYSFEGFERKLYVYGWLEKKEHHSWPRRSNHFYKVFRPKGSFETFDEAKAKILS